MLTIDYSLQQSWQHFLSKNRLSVLEKDAQLNSQAVCGRIPNIRKPSDESERSITIKTDGKSACFSGLYECQNSWSCPVCSALKANQASQALTAVIEKMSAIGIQACMVTMTVPHCRKDGAKVALDRLEHNWRRFMHSHWWTRRANQAGILGYVRATECSFGHNGYHFHYHVCFFAADVQVFDELEVPAHDFWARSFDELYRHRYGRRAYLETAGWHVSRNKRGEVRNITNGNYIAKFAREITKQRSPALKHSKSRNIFDLLKTGDFEDYRRYYDYAIATRRKHRLLISKSIRPLWNAAVNSVHEERVGQVKKKFTPVAQFSLFDWSKLCEAEWFDNRPHRSEILQAAVRGGLVAITSYCVDNGLPIPRAPDIPQSTEIKSGALTNNLSSAGIFMP